MSNKKHVSQLSQHIARFRSVVHLMTDMTDGCPCENGNSSNSTYYSRVDTVRCKSDSNTLHREQRVLLDKDTCPAASGPTTVTA